MSPPFNFKRILEIVFVSTLKDFEIKQQEAWHRLADYVGGEAGVELVSALKDLYSIYDEGLIDWFAGLYDVKVGGWYYSQSARDNEQTEREDGIHKLCPDIESTHQALRFINNSGLCNDRGGRYSTALPEWMKNDILKFAMSLQDENGFFYHPQWTREKTDRLLSRRARDLMWSVDIITTLGRQPTYDTPSGAKGSGLDFYGNPVKVPELVNSSADAPKPSSTATYSPDFENKDTLIAYLERLKEACGKGLRFYAIGNTMTSQVSQIRKRDRDLKEMGLEANLCETLINWFNEHQNPKNGLWEEESNYLGVNGLLKISGVYSGCGVEMPLADLAAEAAIAAITSDEPIGAGVDLYNTWFAISCIIGNLRRFGKEREIDGVMLNGDQRADRIIRKLHTIAPDAIRKSKEKIAPFRQPDGGYGYHANGSSSVSQGMPVCIPGSREGDINGCIIASHELVGYIYAALDLSKYKVPMFGDVHFERYMEIIEKKRREI